MKRMPDYRIRQIPISFGVGEGIAVAVQLFTPAGAVGDNNHRLTTIDVDRELPCKLFMFRVTNTRGSVQRQTLVKPQRLAYYYLQPWQVAAPVDLTFVNPNVPVYFDDNIIDVADFNPYAMEAHMLTAQRSFTQRFVYPPNLANETFGGLYSVVQTIEEITLIEFM